jgi:hypothetical protein
MNQPRSAVSLRDFLLLVAGVLLSVLLRPRSAEVRASGPQEPLGPICGQWVMQTDQAAQARGQFDAFVLNVQTGELRRTRGGGTEMSVLTLKK